MSPMAGSAAFFVALGVAAIVPAQPASQGGPARPVTFTEDVAPLLFDRCAMCHHPDGPAPFSLLTFDDVKPRAALIAAATQAHFMPPWKTAPGGPEFVGQRPLSEQEIDTIRRWAANGAPQGDPRPLPVPRWSEGWQLGSPDLVVTLPQPFVLPPEGTDVSRVFVIPLPVATLRYVRGLEFRPGNAKVVHHANIRIDTTRASRQLDEEDPAPGYDGLILRSAVFPDGHFLGWTPGQVAPLLPKGLAWRLAPNSDLVVEVHMQPTGKPELVSPSIGLFFGDEPPDRVPLMLRLGRQNLDIAAGDADYTVADSFVLPVDVEVQAVQPHAHHRARHVTGTALLPDGTSRSLIDIPDWDFRWQHVYRYVSPIALPKGTTIAMRYSYDNSAANARNPQQPPLRVTWGQWSRDEMGDLWIQVLTRSEQERQQLNAAFRPKAIAEDAVGYEQMIRIDPARSSLHDDVAVLYLELNRPREAAAHFAATVGLKPDSAPAHYNLATALTLVGRLDEARDEYLRALALRPGYPLAHNNLGDVLLHLGDADGAMQHFREAIALDPSYAEAHFNIGSLAASRGDLAGAAGQFREAIRLRADWVPPLIGLARILIAPANPPPGDAAEAVRLAERAADLTGRSDPQVLAVLNAAQAAVRTRR